MNNFPERHTGAGSDEEDSLFRATFHQPPQLFIDMMRRNLERWMSRDEIVTACRGSSDLTVVELGGEVLIGLNNLITVMPQPSVRSPKHFAEEHFESWARVPRHCLLTFVAIVEERTEISTVALLLESADLDADGVFANCSEQLEAIVLERLGVECPRYDIHTWEVIG